MNILLVVAVLLISFVVITTWIEQRRQRGMAEARPPVSREHFVQALVSKGIAPETALFLHEEVEPYYISPLTPHPEDRWESTMRIDSHDLKDVAAAHCRRFSLSLPSPADPAILPEDPELRELAEWLHNRQLLHAGTSTGQMRT